MKSRVVAYAVSGVIVVVGCTSSHQRQGLAATERTDSAAHTVNAPLEGLFIATSDTPYGAWLMYLDPDSSSRGAMYEPSGSLAICDLAVGPRTVAFRSASDGSKHYRFDGRPQGTGFTGSLEVADSTAGDVKGRFDIAARFLTRTLATAPGNIDGEYRSLTVSPSTGDSQGTKLVLVSWLDSIAGVWVPYDGGASAVNALAGLRRGDTLLFAWHSAIGVEADTGVLHGDTIVFPADSGRLVRQGVLGEILRGPSVHQCH